MSYLEAVVDVLGATLGDTQISQIDLIEDHTLEREGSVVVSLLVRSHRRSYSGKRRISCSESVISISSLITLWKEKDHL